MFTLHLRLFVRRSFYQMHLYCFGRQLFWKVCNWELIGQRLESITLARKSVFVAKCCKMWPCKVEQNCMLLHHVRNFAPHFSQRVVQNSSQNTKYIKFTKREIFFVFCNIWRPNLAILSILRCSLYLYSYWWILFLSLALEIFLPKAGIVYWMKSSKLYWANILTHKY